MPQFYDYAFVLTMANEEQETLYLGLLISMLGSNGWSNNGEKYFLTTKVDRRLKVVGMVFLDAKDLPITYANVRPNRQMLIHRYLDPYTIVKMVNPHAVEQDLPNDMQIHDMVNVSLESGLHGHEAVRNDAYHRDYCG
jgi:hypothetical protein